MTGTDVVVHEPQPGTLALTGDQLEFTPVQRAALGHLGIEDAPPGDQQVFLHIAQRTGLDPFARQLYMIPRTEGSGHNRKTKWTIQTGIDGFRLIAERHPQYRGQAGPQWCGPDGNWTDVWLDPQKPPVAARVGVLRGDRDGPVWGIALFREYAQTTTYDNQTRLTKMWREKGAHMIAKCAEALAIRKAFPTEIGGLHTDDELGAPGPARGAAVRAVPAAPTVAELTGAADVIDVDPEPGPDRPGRGDGRQPVDEPAMTPAPGTARASATGAATPAAADPTPAGPPLPGDDSFDEPPADEPPGPADTDPSTRPQNRKMHALFRDAEVTDRAERLQLTGLLLGRALDTSAGLTVADANVVIDALERLAASGHADGLAGAVNDLLNLAALQETEEQDGEQAPTDDDAQAES